MLSVSHVAIMFECPERNILYSVTSINQNVFCSSKCDFMLPAMTGNYVKVDVQDVAIQSVYP